jgi:hyperosmotically inducible periplasmic protein
MKVIRNSIALIIAFFAVSFVSVNAQGFSDGKSLSGLERQVFKKINGLPYYGVFDHIAFKVDGNTVTLYGKVSSLGTKKDAERAVKRIDGVETVVNNIDQLPPSSFDNSIRRQVVREFTRSGGSLYRYLLEPNPSVRIIVENGRVTLEGYVSSKGDSNLANVLANTVPGVFNVRNNLVVAKN